MQKLLDLFHTPKTPNTFFITFEGWEGAGKTLQITQLKTYLEKKNFEVITCREPGGTLFGEKLREAMLSSTTPIDPLAQAYLFTSSRAQLLTQVILPFLQKPGRIVLLDRYLDSSLAYQGQGYGLGIRETLSFHQYPPLNVLPHLTFYFSLSWETSKIRQEKRGQTQDYYEAKERSFYEKVMDGYEEVLKIFPERVKKISAEQTPEKIFEDMLQYLAEKGL